MAKIFKKLKINHEVRGYGVLMVIGFLVLFIYSMSLFIPTLWGFITTFKTEEDLYYNVFGLPERWAFENYMTAFMKMSVTTTGDPRKIYVGEMMLNGVLYAVGCTFANVFPAAIVAYVPAGMIASKIGRKKTILIGIVLLGSCFAVAGFYSTYHSRQTPCDRVVDRLRYCPLRESQGREAQY